MVGSQKASTPEVPAHQSRRERGVAGLRSLLASRLGEPIGAGRCDVGQPRRDSKAWRQ